LENYWNVVENYQRAIAQFRRPIDLDQKSWEAHNGLHELCHFGRAQKQRKVRSTDFWRKLNLGHNKRAIGRAYGPFDEIGWRLTCRG
jgi:hypothetical protein